MWGCIMYDIVNENNISYVGLCVHRMRVGKIQIWAWAFCVKVKWSAPKGMGIALARLR